MMNSAVRIEIGDSVVHLATGEHLTFGRNPGPGQIASNVRAVSGDHGVVEAHEHGWTVRSTGSLYSFSVYDTESPSRLFIPLGSGPVLVPFAKGVVTIEIREFRCAFTVEGPAAKGWANSWRSVRDTQPTDVADPTRATQTTTTRPAPSTAQTAQTTQTTPTNSATGAFEVASIKGATMKEMAAPLTEMVWNQSHFIDRRGNVRRWYQVLVALCEPRLRLPADTREERIPTNRQISMRLGISESTLKKYLDQLRDSFGFDTYTEQMRLAVVLIAISQGIVTVNDLSVLDTE